MTFSYLGEEQYQCTGYPLAKFLAASRRWAGWAVQSPLLPFAFTHSLIRFTSMSGHSSIKIDLNIKPLLRSLSWSK